MCATGTRCEETGKDNIRGEDNRGRKVNNLCNIVYTYGILAT